MSNLRFIDITSLLHLGTVTEKVRGHYQLRNVYGSEAPIGPNDILYRETDVAGSYLFYELFHLECNKSRLSLPKGDRNTLPHHILVEQRKIAKRIDIKELRQRLQLTLTGTPAT
jgi:hypothetical protein